MAGTVVRVVGDPDKLAEQVAERIRGEIEEKVQAALKAAREILDKAYEENLARLERELSHAAREAKERIDSYAARREVELRKKINMLRVEAVEQALQEALSRLRSVVGEEEYIAFLSRLVEDAASKAGPGRLTLVPVRGDEDAVKAAAKRARLPSGVKVEVSAEERVEGLGGFLARTEAGVTLDYRLDVVLSAAIEEARSRIVETLFK